MNQAALSELSEFLNAAGWNYSVFLHAYATPNRPGLSPEQLVCEALGESAVVGDVADETLANVLSEFKASVSYAGDSGAGPDPVALKSERFASLLENALAEVANCGRAAERVAKFHIKEGRPAYPVFWDFAFLFTGPHEVVALVGSSSD
jgi:hypothetical protein